MYSDAYLEELTDRLDDIIPGPSQEPMPWYEVCEQADITKAEFEAWKHYWKNTYPQVPLVQLGGNYKWTDSVSEVARNQIFELTNLLTRMKSNRANVRHFLEELDTRDAKTVQKQYDRLIEDLEENKLTIFDLKQVG